MAVASVLMSMALVVLDANAVNVALPAIAQSLRIAPALSVLVVTAYQASLLMALLPCGALGERLGFRLVFAGGVAVFAAASAFSAWAPTLPWLLAARFVQGLGGAAVMALGVALLRQVVGSEKLGAAIGWNAMTIALCSAIGPTVGSLILTGGGWRWLFALNLPVASLALFAARALPRTTTGSQPLDLVSAGLNAVMFGAFIAGAQLVSGSPGIAAGLLATGALAVVTLVRREMPKRAPLVPLDLLRNRAFLVSVIASVCCFAGQAGGLLALPFHLQHELGLTVLGTGMYMTAWPLAVAVAAFLAGRLADRLSTAVLCAAGGAALSLGLAATALWPSDADPAGLIAFTVLCGLGFGFFQAPNNRNLFLSAPPERSGAAGGMQGTARLTGQTAGAVMVALFFSKATMEAGPRLAFGAAAALALAAALISALRLSSANGIRGRPS